MTETNNYQGYQEFNKRIDTLSNLIEGQISIVRSLNMPIQETNLKQLKENVQSTSFKVMVLGEFKRGKSTFINALLGEEVLPAYSTPCTAIINEVKWSDTKRALLHFNKVDGKPSSLPINVPVDQKSIEEYVVIKDDIDQSQAINESPYEKLELFWPLDICHNGVEIIDSPGLNEHKTRQQITENYLVTVDAILFVLSCEQLFSKSEQEMVDNKLKPMGHDDIFFVCNRINMIRRNEVDKVKQFAVSKLSSRTRRGADRIFFVNALGALEGKLDGDTDAVDKSGIPQLEEDLQKFLANEKGRVKILRPANDLKNSVHEVRKTIPEQRSMLQTDMAVLEKRYVEAQEPLRRLETERQNIVTQIDIFIQDTKDHVRDKSSEFCRSLASKLLSVADEYELKTEIKLISFNPDDWKVKSRIESAIKEVISYLEIQVESEFAAWQKSELEPLMERKLSNLAQTLDARAEGFLSRIDNLRLQVSGVPVKLAESEVDVIREVSPMERILSAAGGFLIGGIGSAGLGAVFGYQEMLKSLIPQIVAVVVSILLLGTNPVTLIHTMLAVGFGQAKFMEGGLGEKIKKQVGQKFAEQFKDSKDEMTNKIVTQIEAELKKIKDSVNQGLGAEIQNIRQQLDTMLAEKKKGQAQVDQKLRELDNLSQSVDKFDKALDELILQISKN